VLQTGRALNFARRAFSPDLRLQMGTKGAKRERRKGLHAVALSQVFCRGSSLSLMKKYRQWSPEQKVGELKK
jgi:hypothetical protein